MKIKTIEEWEKVLDENSDWTLEDNLLECISQYEIYKKSPIKNDKVDNVLITDLMNRMIAIKNLLGRRLI